MGLAQGHFLEIKPCQPDIDASGLPLSLIVRARVLRPGDELVWATWAWFTRLISVADWAAHSTAPARSV